MKERSEQDKKKKTKKLRNERNRISPTILSVHFCVIWLKEAKKRF